MVLCACRSPDCEATVKGRPKLREHLRSHTQEKVVACPSCGGMYANNTKFFDHIKRQSATEGEAPGYRLWQAHIITVSTLFSFSSLHLIIVTLSARVFVGVGQRFQCSHCSKRFATERLLRDHMRTHGQCCQLLLSQCSLWPQKSSTVCGFDENKIRP